MKYGQKSNQITGWSDEFLQVSMKSTPTHSFSFSFLPTNQLDEYLEEGRANQLLIRFFSTLLDTSFLSLSLSMEKGRLALHIEGIDYEDIYLRLKDYL